MVRVVPPYRARTRTSTGTPRSKGDISLLYISLILIIFFECLTAKWALKDDTTTKGGLILKLEMGLSDLTLLCR